MNRISMLAMMACGALLLLPGAAQAADNKIRVVQPDGSVQEFEIPGAHMPPPAPPPQAESAPAPAPAVKEKKEAAKPAPVPQAVQAAPETEPKPEPEPQARPAPVVKRAAVPRPPHKPLLRAQEAAETPPSAEEEPGESEEAVTGPEISRETAIAVALSEAPPARSMNVSRRSFEGRRVFVVSFLTDDGAFDVLVDRVSGEIVHSQEGDAPRGPYIPQPRRAE